MGAAETRVDRRTRAARSEGRDGREALLAGAAAVFAERGFRGASVEEIARRAGFSKGALYWHFESKDDLFFALLEQRVDRPVREAIALLESAPPERDMSVEASRVFVELLTRERELLLLDQEYWALAARDARLRVRYARREAELRAALSRALAARVEHLGRPVDDTPVEEIATTFLALAKGLALAKLVDADAVPDHLLGETFALVYAGLIHRAATFSHESV
jgi:AcrR family transcriptional regulator